LHRKFDRSRPTAGTSGVETEAHASAEENSASTIALSNVIVVTQLLGALLYLIMRPRSASTG
jgi:hypothetical protein